jgi:hypothetical protein
MHDPLRRSIAFAAAATGGFAMLAAVDGWHPTVSWLDRLTVYSLGFSIARAVGAFAGAPMRRSVGQRVVTRNGLVAALFMSIANFVWVGALFWAVAAPALGEAMSWSLDLKLMLLVGAVAPLWLLAAHVERPRRPSSVKGGAADALPRAQRR